ncbi:hypothetical protein TNCV_3111851 [Trichonephila clavipes]|nr:hypothetical protein TNCV_3111851 [Trichonephila clavipes]
MLTKHNGCRFRRRKGNNNAAPVPPSSPIRNNMKTRSYLDAHFNGFSLELIPDENRPLHIRILQLSCYVLKWDSSMRRQRSSFSPYLRCSSTHLLRTAWKSPVNETQTIDLCGCPVVKVSDHDRHVMSLSEGRFDLSTFRSERMKEASTLTITPKRSSSRDVGTSSYRYHTATYNPASVSANRRTNDTIFVASM